MKNRASAIAHRRSQGAVARRSWKRALLIGCFLHPLFSPGAFLLAAPTQDDVFRSIQSNVSGGGGSGGSTIVLLVVVAVVLLLLVYLGRRARPAPTGRRVVNHSGKLLREIRREVGLRPAELKQLKLLSEQLATEKGPGPHPLTLLICPSVLARAVATPNARINRQVLAGLVKRMKAVEG